MNAAEAIRINLEQRLGGPVAHEALVWATTDVFVWGNRAIEVPANALTDPIAEDAIAWVLMHGVTSAATHQGGANGR